MKKTTQESVASGNACRASGPEWSSRRSGSDKKQKTRGRGHSKGDKKRVTLGGKEAGHPGIPEETDAKKGGRDVMPFFGWIILKK